jgi:hypothetical protein
MSKTTWESFFLQNLGELNTHNDKSLEIRKKMIQKSVHKHGDATLLVGGAGVSV